MLGPRLGPSGGRRSSLDELLDDTDAVYLTAGDVEAVRQARRARTLVATRAASRRSRTRTWSSTPS